MKKIKNAALTALVVIGVSCAILLGARAGGGSDDGAPVVRVVGHHPPFFAPDYLSLAADVIPF